MNHVSKPTSFLPRMIIAALLCASATAASAQVTYSYTGLKFSVVSGSYTTDDGVVASFTLAEPLPANSTTDIAGLATSYSFTDGVQTLTEANSLFFGQVLSAPGTDTVTTDSSGNPVGWSLGVLATPVPDMVGEPVSAVQFFFLEPTERTLIFESGYSGIACDGVNNGVCVFTSPGALGQIGDSGSTGLFSLGAGSPPPWAVVDNRSIPTLSGWGLILLVAALGLIGVFALRGRARQNLA